MAESFSITCSRYLGRGRLGGWHGLSKLRLGPRSATTAGKASRRAPAADERTPRAYSRRRRSYAADERSPTPAEVDAVNRPRGADQLPSNGSCSATRACINACALPRVPSAMVAGEADPLIVWLLRTLASHRAAATSAARTRSSRGCCATARSSSTRRGRRDVHMGQRESTRATLGSRSWYHAVSSAEQPCTVHSNAAWAFGRCHAAD